MLWHGDPVSVLRILGISLVILGVAGLQAFGETKSVKESSA